MEIAGTRRAVLGIKLTSHVRRLESAGNAKTAKKNIAVTQIIAPPIPAVACCDFPAAFAGSNSATITGAASVKAQAYISDWKSSGALGYATHKP
jgi:hypothetical protein